MIKFAIINDSTGEVHFADTLEEAEELAMEMSIEDGETYAIYGLKMTVKAPPLRKVGMDTFNGVQRGVDYPATLGR